MALGPSCFVFLVFVGSVLFDLYLIGQIEYLNKELAAVANVAINMSKLYADCKWALTAAESIRVESNLAECKD